MVRYERPERPEDPDELPVVRGSREDLFPPDAVDLAYLTYLQYLEGAQFLDIGSQRELLSELGRVVYSLDTLIQYYGHPAYEYGGQFEGAVSELTHNAPEENALILARSSSRITDPRHFEMSPTRAITFPLTNRPDKYFALVNFPQGDIRSNPDMPANRGASLIFREGIGRLGPHAIKRGMIGDARGMFPVGLEELDDNARDAGRVFDIILKKDFPRTMPK